MGRGIPAPADGCLPFGQDCQGVQLRCAQLLAHLEVDHVSSGTSNKAKQQGKELGLARGRHEGQADLLLRQIDRKFGTPSESVQKLIARADQGTLLRLSDRILTAESIDALPH